jgi:hypothetical protein
VEFAIGARRTAPLWRILDSVPVDGWTEAVDMTAAQVAVAEYCPNWWPAATRLLIRRVRLDLDRGQVSGDPRARRRRTLHPQQRALPLDELAEVDAVFAYSFIVTNLDVSPGAKAAQVEHWYRHRTQVENLFRDTKHGAALRHLPSGYQAVNRAWMWSALLAATTTGWLHQLTATTRDGRLVGHGVRGGQAMIATLRRRLIAVPARLIRHARGLTLRPPPGHPLLAEVLARLRALPETVLTRPNSLNAAPEHAHPRRHSGCRAARHTLLTPININSASSRSARRLPATDPVDSRFAATKAASRDVLFPVDRTPDHVFAVATAQLTGLAISPCCRAGRYRPGTGATTPPAPCSGRARHLRLTLATRGPWRPNRARGRPETITLQRSRCTSVC